jgi:hypothetical protein
MNTKKEEKRTKKREEGKMEKQRKESVLNSKLKGEARRIDEHRERERTSTGKEEQKGSGA